MRKSLMLMGLLMVSSVVLAKTFDTAHAVLINSEGKDIGYVLIQTEKAGVRLSFHLTSIPPGLHGFHIHETGKCEPPEFTSAGGHYNPLGKKHGKDNPKGEHVGDLPNLDVGPEGKLTHYVLWLSKPDIKLTDDPDGLLKKEGTAFVIHAKPDDYVSDPAGDAGPRIACGVIKPGKPPIPQKSGKSQTDSGQTKENH